VEEVLARAMRRWATPQAMRDRVNPVQPTPRRRSSEWSRSTQRPQRN
jgi:hypothetical protein